MKVNDTERLDSYKVKSIVLRWYQYQRDFRDIDHGFTSLFSQIYNESSVMTLDWFQNFVSIQYLENY